MLRRSCCIFSLILLFWSTAISARPTPVFVKTLAEEPFSSHIEALGTLHASESVTLSATVTETIRAIHFDDGQTVKANDVLVEMTDREQTALLQEARSARDEAERQLRRVQTLVEKNLANQALLDERQQAFEAAEARWMATQSRLEQRLIIAPFDGVVGLRNISRGALVRPGDPITTLDDISILKLDMSMPAVYLDQIQPGMPISAQASALKNRTFHGEIKSIDTRVDPVTRSVVVRAQVPNADLSLRPGMLMAVYMSTAETPKLLLPEEALVQEGFRKFVYMIDPRVTPAKVVKREIKTGDRLAGNVVVKSGLQAGDRVVTHGTMHLKDGSEVTISAEDSGDRTLTELLRTKPDATVIP